MVKKFIDDKIIILNDVYIDDIDMTVYVRDVVVDNNENSDTQERLIPGKQNSPVYVTDKMNLFGGDQ